MSNKIGSCTVNEVAEEMNVHKTRVRQLTTNVFRKLRWPNQLKEIEEFINEYSKQVTE